MFTEQLKKVIDGVEGGVGAVLMGLDGIAVDKYMAENTLDVTTIGMEFSYILNQIRKAGDILQIGDVDEFCIRAEQLILVTRMLTDEYFVAAVLGADGNFGKCRYMLRLVAPALTAEL